ncbi:hypothetical protein FEM03_01485 [Phragmitibacter flavus]|uniref:Uncharacterized protein n=2 Tax=Phragmitibacter flavus TaxID=2576071 RepID=A0A5R8KKC2_9BACT|nr:hypothetical protein FEM03_01485 [Phragmitibacter flavus]
MKANSQNLKVFRNDRALVSIRRDECDDRKLQGFIVDFSESLILLQYVYDFRVDGRLLLRIEDITDMESTETDQFQKQLLLEEGDFEKIDFSRKQPISSYDAYLLSLPRNEIVILEDELAEDPEFLIGTLMFADDQIATVRFFNGAAKWKDQPSDIEIKRITCCQTRNNYINYYANHFARKGTLLATRKDG